MQLPTPLLTRVLVFAIVAFASLAPLRAAMPIDSSHPDQRNQALGFERAIEGRFDDAARFFRMAARFGDKPSQLALAIMYRDGVGVATDPALAYAWCDLAAERGYPQFLFMRERIWNSLDEAGRQRAVAVGRELYAEYGDAVAKPRLEARLQRGYRRATGSRTGAVDESLQVGIIERGRGRVVAGQLSSSSNALNGLAASAGRVRQYYSSNRWVHTEYWAQVDAVWLPKGRVEVGEIENVD